MKTKNILIVLIAIIFIAICLFVAKRCSEVPVETIVAKLDEVKDKNGKTHFRKKVEIGTTEIKKSQIDSLKKVIEAKNTEIALKNVEINSITELNASIRDTLKDFKLERDENINHNV